jgi:hypothetical protein
VSRYPARQPKPGDVILCCDHALGDGDVFRGETQWFSVDAGSAVTSPDGAKHRFNWIVLCPSCWRSIDGDTSRVHEIGFKFKNRVTWKDDVPVIVEDFV